MDVSKDYQGQNGAELIETLVQLTGLPETLVKDELGKVLSDSGHTADSLTLDDLRMVMMAYLNSVNTQVSPEPAAE